MEDGDRHLETAITALKAARDAIRDAKDPEPADLGPVGHDDGDDPAPCVEMIRLRLDDVVGRLGDVDSALEHTHGLAAKLHRP